MAQHNYYVENELGRLRKLVIHSPDGGIGKIIPGTFADNLYDDIVHLNKMQKEYNHYVKLLLYFLDREKVNYINQYQQTADEEKKSWCYIPGKDEYFNSEKVLDTQQLLAEIIKDEKVKLRLISAICSYEESSYAIQQVLENINDAPLLAKIFITGILPAEAMGTQEDQYIFPPIPNFIFTRDIGIMVKDHILLSRMATVARRRESLLTKFLSLYYFFKDEPQKVMEIIEESDFFLYEEEERKHRIITIEGGDVMMIHPKHFVIGCSIRTSSSAVNEMVHTLFSKPELGIEKVSVVKIPKNRAQMHIDTIFTQVKRNVWVLYGRFSERILRAEHISRHSYVNKLSHNPRQLEMEQVEILQFQKPTNEPYIKTKDYSIHKRLPGIESLLRQISVEDFGANPEDVKIIYSGGNLFPHDEREQWTDSCNVVAVKEGVVIGYDRNDKTADAFKEAGFNVLTTTEAFEQFEKGVDPETIENTLILLPSAELSRARGGSHCMSMPLLRDKL
ncbi:arginine deiminase family protein [Lacibacter sp.]|uniref:arginine deiminase family protein n=1 Tax=Lacibacter sp. TaxID=1915409 RepID=UPI002B4B6329|nr:arginine deiminase family protein [Lacibacter sp.]HLP35673.1 arginine deiminase family protein [Lacibacter sp.]